MRHGRGSAAALGKTANVANIRRAMKETVRGIRDGLQHALRRVHFDLNPDVCATTLIAGTGRSGTAWVANIVNYDNASRYMFEPFHPYNVARMAAFRYRQYLRPNTTDPAFVEPARAILTGRIKDGWIDQFNRRVFSRSRVIKEIRANLMLKWLKTQFPKMKLVLVLRHPCADANARLHLGWKSHLDELLSQDDLVSDHLAPFVLEIGSAASEFEKHVYLWCIENYVALRQLAPGDVHLAFYENLCRQPRQEVARLFAFLGKPLRDEVYAKMDQPTVLSREESAVVVGGDLIDSWRSQVLDSQARAARNIVRLFGLDAIYGDRSTPNIESATALLGRTTVRSRQAM